MADKIDFSSVATTLSRESTPSSKGDSPVSRAIYRGSPEKQGLFRTLITTIDSSELLKAQAIKWCLLTIAGAVMGVAIAVLFGFFVPLPHAGYIGLGLEFPVTVVATAAFIKLAKWHESRTRSAKWLQQRDFTLKVPLMQHHHHYNEIPLQGIKFEEKEIDLSQAGGNTLFLGSIPNKKQGHAEKLQNDGVKTVLSLNEDWELNPDAKWEIGNGNRGHYEHYTDEDLEETGMVRLHISADDHALLNVKQMERSAAFTAERLQEGNMYVHCRHGAGRSATAIAAYMIAEAIEKEILNTNNMDSFVDAICKHIKKHRACSSIAKKREALINFANHLFRKKLEKISRPGMCLAQQLALDHPGKSIHELLAGSKGI